MVSFNGPLGQEDMPYLLTPGPLTTSRSVKQTLLADWGSRDVEFRRIVKDIREQLLELAGCDHTYECVLMQGSGTFAIEAALGSLTPAKRKKTLVVANGAYGERAAKILEHIGHNMQLISLSDTTQVQPKHFTRALDEDRYISHVWLIHCETTSGIVNPISELASEAKSRGQVFMVDAMSSFGALDINMVRD
jgi:2-aminoethylphosphonate-pyruvate transaminase